MTFTKSTPEWAVSLVEQVCKDYHRQTPRKFQWYKTKNNYTSGLTWTYGSKIHISAGRDEWEQRVVLLHELAHHILGKTRKGRREHHSVRFWRLLFELGERYATIGDVYNRDIELFNGWRPGTRRKALVVYDTLPKK